MDPATQQLTVELERKLLERLVYEWNAINYLYFKSALRKPNFRLSETRRRLGRWCGDERCLEISRPLVLERPWPVVIEVLKHEIAHQFAEERLGLHDFEDAHGPGFRRLCDELGIDGRAQGEPEPAVESEDDPASRTVDRIRKLLALAQSPNQNEAETAATAARRLMLKFNIEVDEAITATAERAGIPRRRYGYRHLGKPNGRVLEHERWLAKILTDFFFVEGLWIPVYRPLEGKRGSVFEICGLEANLLMAEHVHAFLTTTADRLWKEYRRANGISNRDRQAFLAGVMRGFAAKLEAQSTEFHEQGLVWVPAPDLVDYHRRRHPKVVTVSRGGARRNQAFAEGSKAGRKIVLSQPVSAGSSGSGKGRPKALGSG